MISDARQAILRSLCFHEAWQYAPTRAELIALLDIGTRDRSGVGQGMTRGEAIEALDMLLHEGLIREVDGRIGFPETLDQVCRLIRERDYFQPRKRRRALIVARWLVRLSGVRFVALANTTALGNARDEGDLDFFVITHAGTIWSTRLCGGSPFKFLGWMPTEENSRDAVCLSYFIADTNLNLETHQLKPDDPYYRHWFLSLLPLYDDGVSKDLWHANALLRVRHPFAERWIPPLDLALSTPRFRFSTWAIESLATKNAVGSFSED